MWKYLLKLDMLAPSVQLRIAGNTSSKSLVGVVLFLSYLGTALWASYMQILSYRDRTKPVIFTDTTYVPENPTFDLAKSASIPIMIGAYRGVDYTKPDELASFVTLKLWVTKFAWNRTAGEYQYTPHEVPIVPCKSLLDSGELDLTFLDKLSNSYLEIIPEYGMCANTTGFDVTVVGSNADKDQSFVYLCVSPCSLPGGVGCKPAVEVNRMWIQTLSTRVSFNVSSQTNPVKHMYSSDDLFPLNVNNLQLFKYEMVNNQVMDSFGFLAEDLSTESFVTQSQRPPLIKARDSTILQAKPEDLYFLTTPTYITFEWSSGTKFNLIRRNYQGIIDLVSNIGGLNSIIWTFASAIHFLLHPFFEKRQLVKSIFGIKKGSRFARSPSSKVVNLATSSTSSAVPRDPSECLGSTPEGSQHITSNSPYTIVSKEVFEEASKIIDEDLDVINICRQLHELKIIVELLLKKDQTELIPLATLCRRDRRPRISTKPSAGPSASHFLATSIGSSIPDGHRLQESSTERAQLARSISNLRSFKGTDRLAHNSNATAFDEGRLPVQPKSLYRLMLEGLEEEFNKLIRTEVVGDALGQTTMISRWRFDVKSLISSNLGKSGILASICGPDNKRDAEKPGPAGSQGTMMRASLKSKDPELIEETSRTEPVPQQARVGSCQESSTKVARPNSNILSAKIPVIMPSRTPKQILGVAWKSRPSK